MQIANVWKHSVTEALPLSTQIAYRCTRMLQVIQPQLLIIRLGLYTIATSNRGTKYEQYKFHSSPP